MKKTVLAPLLFITVLFLSACMPIQDPAAMQAEVAPSPTPMVMIVSGQVPRITLDEAKQHFDSGTAHFVDTRTEHEYDQSHIPTAIHLEEQNRDIRTTLETLGDRLLKDRLIITYSSSSSGTNEIASAIVTFQLYKNGYPQVSALLGGMAVWVEAGYRVEETEQ